MNKLIIIGNGFDMAHGLPTSYKDFVEYFWEKLRSDYSDPFMRSIVEVDESYYGVIKDYPFDNPKEIVPNISKYAKEYNYYFDRNSLTCSLSYQGKVIFEFKNLFFRVINQQLNINNWVDIENLYYQILKSKAKGETNKYHYTSNIEILNQEFEQIKSFLAEYLEDVVSGYDMDNYNDGSMDEIRKYMKPIDLRYDRVLAKTELSREDYQEANANQEMSILPKSYVLNFNYTPTLNIYSNLLKKEDENLIFKINHIHGEIGSLDNSINFGFGDEMDEEYRMIENKDDNEYLRNFKSFGYLQNSNYSNLLSFIEAGKFQVFTMGHSCGLSDRTLLNIIFEHKNCRNIKIFYHQREKELDDGSKVFSDDYLNIAQNISRHFNNKVEMRHKILNKELCVYLPQTKIPKKDIQ